MSNTIETEHCTLVFPDSVNPLSIKVLEGIVNILKEETTASLAKSGYKPRIVLGGDRTIKEVYGDPQEFKVRKEIEKCIK